MTTNTKKKHSMSIRKIRLLVIGVLVFCTGYSLRHLSPSISTPKTPFNGMSPRSPPANSLDGLTSLASINTTQHVQYDVNFSDIWNRDPLQGCYVGDLDVDGFSGSNCLVPEYNEYVVTMKASEVVDSRGIEGGDYTNTWEFGGNYHIFLRDTGPDTAWATWSLGSYSSSDPSWSVLDSRRVASLRYWYQRKYASWWGFEGPNGGIEECSSCIFVGSATGDVPQASSSKSHVVDYITDPMEIGIPVYDEAVELEGWNWTHDKDAALFDNNGGASKQICLWQRTYSCFWPYPAIYNKYIKLEATMVGDCSIEQDLSVPLAIPGGWELHGACLSLENLWKPQGVSLLGGNGFNETILGPDASNYQSTNVTLDITSTYDPSTSRLKLKLVGLNYGNISTADANSTWLGYLNCYLDDGNVRVTIKQSEQQPVDVDENSHPDAITRYNSTMFVPSVSTMLPPNASSTAVMSKVEFTTGTQFIAIDWLEDAQGNIFSNLPVVKEGSTFVLEISEELNAWLLARPGTVLVKWRLEFQPFSNPAIQACIDPTMPSNINDTTLVDMKEFKEGDLACFSINVDDRLFFGEGVNSTSVNLELQVGGMRVEPVRVLSEPALDNQTRLYIFFPITNYSPGEHDINFTFSCNAGNDTLKCIAFHYIEDALSITSFPSDNLFMYPVLDGLIHNCSTLEDRIIIDYLPVKDGTRSLWMELPAYLGTRFNDLWNITIYHVDGTSWNKLGVSVLPSQDILEITNDSQCLVAGRYIIDIEKPSLTFDIELMKNETGTLVPWSSEEITLTSTAGMDAYFFNVTILDDQGNKPVVFDDLGLNPILGIEVITGENATKLDQFPLTKTNATISNSLTVPMGDLNLFSCLNATVQVLTFNCSLEFQPVKQFVYRTDDAYALHDVEIRSGVTLIMELDDALHDDTLVNCSGSTIDLYMTRGPLDPGCLALNVYTMDCFGNPVFVKVACTLQAGTLGSEGNLDIIQWPVNLLVNGKKEFAVPNFMAPNQTSHQYFLQVDHLDTNNTLLDIGCVDTKFKHARIDGNYTMTNASKVLFNVKRRPVCLEGIFSSSTTTAITVPVELGIVVIDALTGKHASGCLVEYTTGNSTVLGQAISGENGVASLPSVNFNSLGSHEINASIIFYPENGDRYEHVSLEGNPLRIEVNKSKTMIELMTIPADVFNITATNSFFMEIRLWDVDANEPMCGETIQIQTNQGENITVVSGNQYWWNFSMPGDHDYNATFAGNDFYETSSTNRSFYVYRTSTRVVPTTGLIYPGEPAKLAASTWDEKEACWLANIPIEFLVNLDNNGSWAIIGRGITNTSGVAMLDNWSVPVDRAGTMMRYKARCKPNASFSMVLDESESEVMEVGISKINTTMNITCVEGYAAAGARHAYDIAFSMLDGVSGREIEGKNITIWLYEQDAQTGVYIPVLQGNMTVPGTWTFGPNKSGTYKVVGHFKHDGTHHAASEELIINIPEPSSIRIEIVLPSDQDIIVGIPVNITIMARDLEGNVLDGIPVGFNISRGILCELSSLVITGMNSTVEWTPAHDGEIKVSAWYNGDQAYSPAVRTKAMPVTAAGLTADVILTGIIYVVILIFLVLAKGGKRKCQGKKRMLKCFGLLFIGLLVSSEACMGFSAGVGLQSGDIIGSFNVEDIGHSNKLDGIGKAGSDICEQAYEQSRGFMKPVEHAVDAAVDGLLGGTGWTDDADEGDGIYDATAPSITIVSPSVNEAVTGDELLVEATIVDERPGVERASYEIFKDGVDETNIYTGMLDNERGSTTFNATRDVSILENGDYVLRINATDHSGNNQSVTRPFTIAGATCLAGDDEGDVEVPFACELTGTIKVTFTTTERAIYHLVVEDLRGMQVDVPVSGVIWVNQPAEVVLCIDPEYFEEGNYTITILVINEAQKYHEERYLLQVGRKSVTLELEAVTNPAGGAIYTNHEFTLRATMQSELIGPANETLKSISPLASKRVQFHVCFDDKWISAGWAATDSTGTACLPFKFTRDVGREGCLIHERGKYVFKATFEGDDTYKALEAQLIAENKGIKTEFHVPSGLLGASTNIEVQAGDPVNLGVQFFEVYRPGNARLLGNAQVDFFIDCDAGNRTYLGSNATSPTTGQAKLKTIVLADGGLHSISFEFSGNDTHAGTRHSLFHSLVVTRAGTSLSFVAAEKDLELIYNESTSVRLLLVEDDASGCHPVAGGAIELLLMNDSGLEVALGSGITTSTGNAVIEFTINQTGVATDVAVDHGAFESIITSNHYEILALYAGSGTHEPVERRIPVLLRRRAPGIFVPNCTFQLGERVVLEASVTGEDGSPVVGSLVTAVVEGNGFSRAIMNSTGSDGRAFFDLDVPQGMSAGGYDVTIMLEREGTTKHFPGALTLVPCDTMIMIDAASSVLALDDIPVTLRLVDARGNGLVGEAVRVEVVALSDNESREVKTVITGANGIWTGALKKLPPGSYLLIASFNGSPDFHPSGASKGIAVTNIPVPVQFTSLSAEWVCPGDAMSFTINARDGENEDQFVPLQVLSNGTVVMEGVLLPGELTIRFDWTVPLGYTSGQVNLTVRINEELSSFRGQATEIINVKSKTSIHARLASGAPGRFNGMHFVGETGVLDLQLLEDDGDPIGNGTMLFDGTYQFYNSSLRVTRWDAAALDRDTNASGEVAGGIEVRHEPVAGNETSELRWIEIAYAGDPYHDPCSVTTCFTVLKRPLNITITNVTRVVDDDRPSTLFHRNDSITITGRVTDLLNLTGGREWCLEGLDVLVLVDGVAAGNCAVDAANGFEIVFRLVDMPNRSTWQAGYHEIEVMLPGTAEFAPTSRLHGEPLQVMEYTTVTVAARDGLLGWLGAKLTYSFHVVDEDGSVQPEAWAWVVKKKIHVGDWICSEEVLEQGWSKGGSFEMPVSERGWYAVEVHACNEWWKSPSVDVDASVTWEQLEEEDVEEVGTPAHLLVNAPGETTSCDAARLSEVDLKVICLPVLISNYAFALVKTANNFKARLALRAITFVIWWALQDEVYLTDLIQGLITMLIAAMWQWVLEKVAQKVPFLAQFMGTIWMVPAPAGLLSLLEEQKAQETEPSGPGRWKREVGVDGNPTERISYVFEDESGAITERWEPEYDMDDLSMGAGGSTSSGDFGSMGGGDGNAMDSGGSASSGDFGSMSGGDGVHVDAGGFAAFGTCGGLEGDGSTCAVEASCAYTESMPENTYQPMTDDAVDVEATFTERLEDEDVKELVTTEGASSSNGAQKDLGKITNVLTFIKLGLLALGSLFTAWEVELERGPKQGMGYVVQSVLCKMLLSATMATFMSLRMIMNMMESLGMSESVASAAMALVFAMVAGLLLGSVIVEVLRWVIEAFIIKAPLSTLPPWLRFFVDMVLEMLRWTVTLVFTYYVLQSGTSVAMSAIVSMIREMIVSMLKEMLKEVIFLLLMAAAGEIIDDLAKAVVDAATGSQAVPDMDGGGNFPNNETRRRMCRMYKAQYWKDIGGSATPVCYIMHSKSWKRLKDWIYYVLVEYAADICFSTRFGGPIDYTGALDAIWVLLMGLGDPKVMVELYATLCAMLHVICEGYELLYVYLPFCPMYDDSDSLTLDPNQVQSAFKRTKGPDIVARSPSGEYAIIEAKGLSSKSGVNLDWHGSFSSNLVNGEYECSRDWMGNSTGRKNDYIGTLNKTYKEAYDVCIDIRENNAPYNVYYIVGYIGNQPLRVRALSDSKYGGVDQVKLELDNQGRFSVALYELQHGAYLYPDGQPDEEGGVPRSIVFERHPELKECLN